MILAVWGNHVCNNLNQKSSRYSENPILSSHRRMPALSYNPGKESKPLPYVRRPIDYAALDHVGHGGGARVAPQKNISGGGDGDSADSVSTNSARDTSTLRQR